MSLPKKDRKIQPSRQIAEPPNTSELGSADFARAVADALHKEFGDTHAAVKTIVARTRANERAVKNWFSAKNGPTGRHLVDLVRTSDEVLEVVLRMSGRNDLILAKRLSDSKQTLLKMLTLISELQTQEDGWIDPLTKKGKLGS
ncbi:hypothetical protein E3H11_10515 [Bradyrhizobium brasilense]|uniref:hypothetical protein n=1 Tax=Bradyrhizobium brasilense TaxID=1419277 RepID=UPI001456F57D|nr:hypothetical protein [Bradyrhizobium brasilense]NLS69344.1 hypothetical protein [Bradyrhizobium brasilense]